MKQEWIEYFMEKAFAIAKKSKDPKTKCGAILAGKNHEVISEGFNGYPIGWSDEHMASHSLREAFQDGVIHAEHNALIFANPLRLKGSSLFVTKMPCTKCAAAISQYRAIYGGPKRIYCPPIAKDSEWRKHEQHIISELKKSKIKVIYTENKQ